MRPVPFNHIGIAATLGMVAAAILFQPVPAAAQQGRAASSQPGTTGKDATAKDAQGQGNAPDAKDKISNADSKLMRDMAQAHLLEIKLSALATAISANQPVRAFATTMLEDHQKAFDSLRMIAEKGGVILPGGVETEQAGNITKLAHMVSPEFDQSYMGQAGIAAHEQSQKLFEEASNRAEAPALKAYATKLVPVIRKHMKLAQRTKEEMGKPGAMAPQVGTTPRVSATGGESGSSSGGK